MNSKQWEVLLATLFGSGGPVAAILIQSFGWAPEKVAPWLTLVSIITPIVAGAFLASRQTNSAQVASVASMPPAVQATAVASLPDAAQAALATSLPDKAVLEATHAMPGVAVTVDTSVASAGAVAAANNSALPNVQPL